MQLATADSDRPELLAAKRSLTENRGSPRRGDYAFQSFTSSSGRDGPQRSALSQLKLYATGGRAWLPHRLASCFVLTLGRRQLYHRRVLPFTQHRQEHDLPAR